MLENYVFRCVQPQIVKNHIVFAVIYNVFEAYISAGKPLDVERKGLVHIFKKCQKTSPLPRVWGPELRKHSWASPRDSHFFKGNFLKRVVVVVYYIM